MYGTRDRVFRRADTADARGNWSGSCRAGDVIDGVLACLVADGHALLEGFLVLEKPYLFERFRSVWRCSFSVFHSSRLMPADIVGTHILEETDSGNNRMVFEKGLCLVKSCWQMKSTERHRKQCNVGGDAGTPGHHWRKTPPTAQLLCHGNTKPARNGRNLSFAKAQLVVIFLQNSGPVLIFQVVEVHRTTGNQKQSVSAILTRGTAENAYHCSGCTHCPRSADIWHAIDFGVSSRFRTWDGGGASIHSIWNSRGAQALILGGRVMR